MDILLFSDLHAHNFTFGEDVGFIPGFKGAYNSRLVDTYNVLCYIGKYALDRGIKNILFGGDLFHTKQNIDTDTLFVVHEALNKLTKAGLYFHMLPGNHDYGDKEGFIYSGQFLRNMQNVSVHTDISSLTIEDHKEFAHIVAVPFTLGVKNLKAKLKKAGELASYIKPHGPKILLAHLGIQGAKVGSDYITLSNEDVKVEDIPSKAFDACFFGHFHEHQKVFSNGWYIGATHEHTWGDSGGVRGFLHVNFQGAHTSVQHIPLNDPPKFLKIKYSQLGSSVIRPKDFVNVEVPESINKQEVRDKVGACRFLAMSVKSKKKDKVELSEKDILSPQTLVAPWVENSSTNLDRKKLIEVGDQLIREAREKTV